MSEKTPGQVAYEAFCLTAPGVNIPGRWDTKPRVNRDAWEAAAQAAMVHGANQLAADTISDYQTELAALRAQLAAVRQGLEDVAAGLERSAAATSPSKKSQIEASCANAIRAAFKGSQPCPQGCGCRLGTGDADTRNCICDGPCTDDAVCRLGSREDRAHDHVGEDGVQ